MTIITTIICLAIIIINKGYRRGRSRALLHAGAEGHVQGSPAKQQLQATN